MVSSPSMPSDFWLVVPTRPTPDPNPSKPGPGCWGWGKLGLGYGLPWEDPGFTRANHYFFMFNKISKTVCFFLELDTYLPYHYKSSVYLAQNLRRVLQPANIHQISPLVLISTLVLSLLFFRSQDLNTLAQFIAIIAFYSLPIAFYAFPILVHPDRPLSH